MCRSPLLRLFIFTFRVNDMVIACLKYDHKDEKLMFQRCYTINSPGSCCTGMKWSHLLWRTYDTFLVARNSANREIVRTQENFFMWKYSRKLKKLRVVNNKPREGLGKVCYLKIVLDTVFHTRKDTLNST